MNKVIDKKPAIRLRWGTPDSYNDSVGAALVCYDGDIVDYKKKSDAYLRAVGDGCYNGKHHTIFQHATFSFNIENVSRQFVWEILHAYPYYNTSQASQRYVRLEEISAVIPPFKEEKNRELFEKGIVGAWEKYNALSSILTPDVTKYFCEIFNKKKEELTDKDKDSIDKKAIETARYVIPIAAHTTLVYTINGLTLYRLNRLMNQGDSGWEAQKIILGMVEEVKKADSKFFEKIEAAIAKDNTLEARVLNDMGDIDTATHERALGEFDNEMKGLNSKLVGYDLDGEKRVAESVRLVLGIPKDRLSNEEAIDYLLNPKKNPYYSEILNLSTVSPLMRLLFNTSYTFKKRLSHTADSQDQRHRTTPASRPILSLHDTKKPDYITPELIDSNPEAKEIYNAWMEEVWDIKNKLIENGSKPEYALYVLPNAKVIRHEESSPLIYLVHKFNNRSCLNAQREIWNLTMSEIKQIKEVHPVIGRYLGQTTCVNRYQTGDKPTCLEGKRFCGVKVWEKFPNIERKL